MCPRYTTAPAAELLAAPPLPAFCFRICLVMLADVSSSTTMSSVSGTARVSGTALGASTSAVVGAGLTLVDLDLEDETFFASPAATEPVLRRSFFAPPCPPAMLRLPRRRLKNSRFTHTPPSIFMQ